MMAFLLVIHVIICLGLIVLVLVQRGRGGGLVESFSGVESMFGTRTSAFLTKATTILSVAFFLTCISLAALSARRSKSLMRNAGPGSAVSAVEDAVDDIQDKLPEKAGSATKTE